MQQSGNLAALTILTSLTGLKALIFLYIPHFFRALAFQSGRMIAKVFPFYFSMTFERPIAYNIPQSFVAFALTSKALVAST